MFNLNCITDEIKPIIINKLVDIMNVLVKEQDLFFTVEYYNILINLADENNKNKLHTEMAQLYLSHNTDGLNRSIDIQKAIEYYYKIPKRLRANFISENKLKNLFSEKRLSNKDAILGAFKFSHNIPIPNDMFNNIENKIKSSSLIDSIIYLFTETNINIKHIEEEAEKACNKPGLIDYVGIRYNFQNDRVGKLNIPSPPFKTEEREIYKKIKMRELYTYHIFTSSYFIQYIKSSIKNYHDINFNFIYEICAHSNIIPNDNIKLFAKGLWSGFENDFVVSTSILIPQFENMIRFLLTSSGVNTRNMGRDNFDKELSLEELLNNKGKECKEIFGDYYFEIYTLFTNEDCCLNIRNTFAHGLLSYNDFYTPTFIYAWFLIFKMVFTNYYNNIKNNK